MIETAADLEEAIRKQPHLISPPRLPLQQARLLWGLAWNHPDLIRSLDHVRFAHLWTRWLRRLGYTAIQAPYDRPTSPLTLYRGAGANLERGMSWTPSKQIAQMVARTTPWHGSQPQVWSVRARPAQILARIGARGVAYRVDGAEYPFEEFVLDPKGLRPRSLGPAQDGEFELVHTTPAD